MEVHAGGKRVALGGTRNQSILASLLLDVGRPVSIHRLVDAAWGNEPPRSARTQVQNRVGSLRRLLREYHPSGGLIITRGSGYQLDLDSWQLDLRRLDEDVGDAEVLMRRGNFAQARAKLDSAVSLWRGPALDGLTTPPLHAAAVHLEERRLNILEQRIQLDLDLGRHGGLLLELTSLTREHPFREGLHALFILALYRSGRRAEALHAHQRVTHLLAEHLGVEPCEQLRSLHQAMLRGDYSPDGQLPGAENASVTLRAGPTPQELPAEISTFIGRKQALDDMDLFLAGATGSDGAAKIRVVTGTAGVGKTALAVHWAHRVAHIFPDGQLYIDLGGHASAPPMPPQKALHVLLRSLGTEPEHVPSNLAAASAMYRSLTAGRRMLVVLDNARNAEELRPLLPGGPGCLVLVTSRDRLSGLVAREGASRLTLDVVTPREAQTLLSSLLTELRIAASAEAIAELATLCANLPLAMRIAVTRLANRPHCAVEDLLQDLRRPDRLLALSADADEATTVWTAFHQSYKALAPSAQRLFRLLGLTASGGLTAADAAALTGEGTTEAEMTIDRLAAAHMVTETANGVFILHELLRLYARSRAMAENSADERALALHDFCARRRKGWIVRKASCVH
ncbi:AfsR/SARP family transcriptional regulator [Micromonospora sediminicola]|uniref:AfsR/SARP family transcriptional regulator n=1 Tax=Micromonospora sediminicola TaxID=946078 RepID=UPI00379F8C26